MKKRQELATQMQIEGVKDVRGQISGTVLNKNCYTRNIKDYDYCHSYEIVINTPLQTSNTHGRIIQSYSNAGLFVSYQSDIRRFRAAIISEQSSVAAYTVPDNITVIHSVCTIEDNTLTLYINGEVVSVKTITSIFQGAAPFYVGESTGSIAFEGVVKSIRTFNYVLSQSEVTALYNNGKPEEYVISGNMRTGLSRNSFTSIEVAGSTYNVVEGDGYKDYTILTTTYNNTYPRLYTDRLTKDFYDGYIEVELDAECFDENGFSVGKLEGISYSSPENLHVLVKARAIYKFKGKVRRADSTYGGRLYHSIGSNISSNIGKTLRVYSYKVTYCSVIAEYLPQNLISTNDGVMNATTAIKWLDSAKQLPLNDEYLEPLLESIGGYDLTASGEPEIVYKPNVVQFWDLRGEFLQNGDSALNTIASLDIIENGAKLNYVSGGSLYYPRIRYSSIPNYNAIGKRIKIEYDYNVIYGTPKVSAIETIGTIYSNHWTNIGEILIGNGHIEHISTSLGYYNSNQLRLDFGNSDEPYSIEITNVRVSYWNE